MANGLFVNYVSTALVHSNTNKSGKTFKNISIPCKDSKTGFASIGVADGQVFQTTRRDGTPVDGFVNILLGKADSVKKLSVATNKKGTAYKTIEVTAQQIADMFAENRDAYRATLVATEE